MTWGNFFSSLVVAVVVAWLTHRLILMRDEAKVSRDLKYLALQIAFLLEKFAVDCAGKISDAILHDDSSASAGAISFRLPELPEYPREGDYAVVDPKLLARALAFRLEIESGNNAVAFLGEVADGDDQDSECRNQCARLGLKALTLAGDLRKTYKLPGFDLEVHLWDYKEVLNRQFERYSVTRQC